MGKFVVIWKQEMKDGSLQVLDATFDSREEAVRHIKHLREDAITLNKPFRLVSVNDLTNRKIKPNKAHVGRKRKGKGSGWHGESREHGLARRKIKTGKGK